MKLFDERAARVLLTVILFVAAGAFAYGARHVLITSLFAILFAYVLDPWVLRFERSSKISGRSRLVAVIEVYVLLIAAAAIFILVFGKDLFSEMRGFAAALPGIVESIRTGQIALTMGAKHGWSIRSRTDLQNFLQQHSTAVLSWIGAGIAQVAELLSNLLWIALVPILAFFLLKDGRSLQQAAIEAVHPLRRIFVSAVLDDLNEMLALYIRAQLIVSALALIFYMASLSALGVPDARILAGIAGVLEFLPTIGPALSALAILAVAFAAGYQHLLVIVVVLGIWRIVQDYVVFPRITGRRLELHPLLTIMAILIGAEIAGLVGAYVAVPIVAGIRIVRSRWQINYAANADSTRQNAA